MKKSIFQITGLIAAIAFSASAAHAVNSEAFFQAAPGSDVVTPELDFSSQSGDVKNSENDLAETGPTLNMSYERGINDMFAARVQLGYKQGNQEAAGSEGEKEGLEDIYFTLKGQTSFTEGESVHFGAYLKHGLEQATTDVAVNVDLGATPESIVSNASSNGTSITPYLGWQKIVGPQVFGAKLTQTIWGTVRNYETKTRIYNHPIPAANGTTAQKGEERGGGLTELKGFWERPIDNWTIGLAAKFRSITKEEQKNAGGSWATTTDSIQLIGADVYPTYQVNENTTIVGSLGYQTLLTDEPLYNGSTVDSATIINVSVGGRFNF